MALKIKQDGKVKDLIIPACGVQILDMEDNFESSNLEEVLQEIGEGESIYISDEEPDKDGIWISSDNTTTVSENPTLVALKKYIDDKLGAAELTTDDKTIKGAINEHETQLKDVAYKNGTLQTNLNSEMLNGKKLSDLMLKNNGYANDIFNSNNMNDYIKAGIYGTKMNTTNIPIGDGWGTLNVVTGIGDTRVTQIFNAWNINPDILYVRVLNVNTWTPWKQLATSESVEITNFQNGWARHPDLSYGTGLTKVGNLVNLSILVVNPSPSAGTTIFTVPTGFRPSKSVIFPSLQGASCIEARIFTDGRVIINSGSMISNHWISLQVTYSL